MPCWALKNVAESHTHGKVVGEEVCDLEAEKIKDIVISYDIWISCKMEEIYSLTTHYCTIPDRNNTHIGISSTTATDGVSLYKYVMEVVENFGLEENIVGITSDGVGNIWVCREALDSKYSNESVFHHPTPSSPCFAL